MRYMVIEHFPDGDPLRVYRHLAERGRGIPEGLTYVDSWVEAGFARCFELMETDDPALFQQWALHWNGSGVRLEIVPVLGSTETRANVQAFL